MAKTFEVHAKLAQIVSDTQLAFNAGQRDGISNGDTVVLYRTVEVTDPDSNELLGSVSVPKLRLRVNFVDEKFCVAYVTNPEPVGLGGLVFSGFTNTTLKVREGIQNFGESGVVSVQIGEEAVITLTNKGETQSD